MRRTDREITDIAKIEEILSKSKILHLAMFDGEYPYNVPLHYGFEFADGKLVLYMHCAKEGHKLDCLRQNPKVCAALDCDIELIPGDIACTYGSSYASVIARGEAEILADTEEKIHAIKVFMKCQTGMDFDINENMARSVEIIRVTCESFTAKSRPKKN